jgi:hypothetical protein
MMKMPSDPRRQNLNFKGNQIFFIVLFKIKRLIHPSFLFKGFVIIRVNKYYIVHLYGNEKQNPSMRAL